MNARSTPISQIGAPFLGQIRDPALRPPLNSVPPQTNSSGFPTGPNTTQPSTPASGRNVSALVAGIPLASNGNPPAAPSNKSAPFAGFPPGLNGAPPAAPASTNNDRPPFTGYPRSMNASQSTLVPPISNLPVSGGGLPSGTNGNPPASTGNASAFFPGFPPGMNTNQSAQLAFNNNPTGNLPQPYAMENRNGPPAMPMNNGNSSFNERMASFRSQSNRNNDDSHSRLELEYPIENVLIDANIPSSMAIKVNDAVERDRLGNNHIIRRYTFDPPSQHMSFQNRPGQFSDQRTENSRHVGMRHIREISPGGGTPSLDDTEHPRRRAHRHRRRRQQSSISVDRYVDELLQSPGRTVFHVDNSNALQQILAQTLIPPQSLPAQPLIFPSQSSLNSIHEPINYFVARALPYDPMRIL